MHNRRNTVLLWVLFFAVFVLFAMSIMLLLQSRKTEADTADPEIVYVEIYVTPQPAPVPIPFPKPVPVPAQSPPCGHIIEPKNIWEFGFTNILCYTLSNGNVTTYANIDTPFNSLSYIDGSAVSNADVCVINFIPFSDWIQVMYSTARGLKAAYCYLTDFVGNNYYGNVKPAYVTQRETVYKKIDLTNFFDSVDAFAKVYVVGEYNQKAQIVFYSNNIGWKMGWISSESLRY